MEVKQKLHVGAKEFFDALAKSVSYDVSQAVGKKVAPDQLYSGYRYTKKMKNKVGRAGDVSVVLKQFQPPVRYEASFKSAQGVNYIHYEIEDLKDGTILVHYRESFDGGSTTKSLNYKLVSLFYNHTAKKRMTRMLKSMEEYIKKSGEPAGE